MTRSFHFVPGHQRRFLDRIPALEADGVVLELEDGVGLEHKDAARRNVMAFLEGAEGDQYHLRINGLDTEEGRRDLEALTGLGTLPGIVVPKVESPDDVARVVEALGGGGRTVRVLAMVESFQALERVREIARAPHVAGIAVGMEDLLSAVVHASGELGALRETVGSAVVLAAKAAGIPAIDTISTAIRDPDGFRDECRRSREQGFDGRFTIHPSQIAVANEVYGPSPEMVAWARRVEALTGLDASAGYQSIEGEIFSPPKIHKAINILNTIPQQPS